MKTVIVLILLSVFVCTSMYLVSANDGVPKKMITMYSGSLSDFNANMSSCYVICNASNAALYGYVPDLSGRFVMGYNSSNGATYAKTLGQKSGNKTHLNTIGELVSHRHTYTSLVAGTAYTLGTATTTGTAYTGYTGGGAAYDILNPYYTLLYICKVVDPVSCNSTVLTKHENIVDATGTHESVYNVSSGWIVWANYTGNAGGASLLVHNSNPGNGTCTGVNYLQANPVGVKTCVDVEYQNMTVLTEANLGTGYKLAEAEVPPGDIDDVLSFFAIPLCQSFYNSIPNRLLFKINISTDWMEASAHYYCNLYLKVFNADTAGVPYGDSLGQSDIVNLTDSTFGVVHWKSFNFSSPILLKQQNYSFIPYVLSSNYTGANGYGWCGYTGDDYPDGFAHAFGVSWADLTGEDLLFGAYGWSLGGNISWNHVVNLTFSSNATTTGSWMNYSYQNVVANGTVCILNPNMTSNNTDYFWRCNWSTTEISEEGYSIFTFTTSDFRFPLMLKNSSLIVGMSVGGFSGLLFMVFGINRKKKKLL